MVVIWGSSAIFYLLSNEEFRCGWNSFTIWTKIRINVQKKSLNIYISQILIFKDVATDSVKHKCSSIDFLLTHLRTWLVLYLKLITLGNFVNTQNFKNIFEIPFRFLIFQKYMIITIVAVASNMPKLVPIAIQVLFIMTFGLIGFLWVSSETNEDKWGIDRIKP